ncbi:MAG TPA: AMIN domain-containing protein [Terriglobales bacterium]|nr:AMIN domain-containing protein [Terriglobales bacterium]
MFCTRVYFYALLLVALLPSAALAADRSPAAVRSVKIAPGQGDAVTLQVFASRPLKAQIHTVENPLRLVIDLPGSILSTPKKRISFRNQQIKDIRLNQHQTSPEVSRIVIDLAAPVQCTWTSTGNRLDLQIRADAAAAAKPPTVPAAAPSVQPVAVPYAPGASGNLVEAGSRVGNGSSITAKDQTAILRLTRGGEVRVCPGTTLSVATSPTGDDLMLGMNSGSIETHYQLNESSDSILTPDFRIVLPGPGVFNLAIKSELSGDTCVSSLPGSSSSVVVAELLGNGTYEIKPEQQVLFRKGRMQSVETPLAACGCPSTLEPVMRAATDPATVLPENKAANQVTLASPNDQALASQKIAATAGSSSGPGVPGASGESKSPDTAQISTPLVFNAKEFARLRAETPPMLSAKVAALPLSAKPADPLPPIVVLPPNSKQEHKGFLGKVRGFFRKMF